MYYNLIEFFENIIGFSFPVENPLFLYLACIFGFFLVYQVITFLFGSFFGLMNNRK